jgi:hypothetical protein
MTVTVAEGVAFQGRAIEARGRPSPGGGISVETVAPGTGLDASNLDIDMIVDYLERGSRAVSGGLDSVAIPKPESLALFGLLRRRFAPFRVGWDDPAP